MELPNRSDFQLQLALLRAIHQYPDRTAVAEQLRPIVEEELSLIVGDDQQLNWITTISHSLIDMRDKKSWLLSPYYKPESKENKAMNRRWLEINRPGVNTGQRIWTITEKGNSVIHEGISKDQQIPGKKNATTGSLSKRTGPIAKKGGGKLMYSYYQAHISELPKNIHLKRDFIIDLLVKGMSVEDAFSRALKNVV
jgi:hypothetical protein